MPLMQVEGVVETVIVAKAGERFVVIRAADGHCYHRWFHEIEAIEPKATRNEGERADQHLLSHRGA